MAENKSSKTNNSLLGVVAVFAIFLIVFFATRNNAQPTEDYVGEVIEVMSAETSAPICKVVLGRTTLYDDTNLATSLESGVLIHYSGSSFTVDAINSNGCLVSVDGNQDYIAVGQIQQIGQLFVTVRDIVS